jgi:hypothetical protein
VSDLKKHSKTVSELWEQYPASEGNYVPFWVAQCLKNERDILQAQLTEARKWIEEIEKTKRIADCIGMVSFRYGLYDCLRSTLLTHSTDGKENSSSVKRVKSEDEQIRNR